MRAQLSAIGAHIYSGGFTVGASKHFNVEAHLEEEPWGTAVVEDNFPKLAMHLSKPTEWPLKRYRDVDLFIANPPCAPWSQAAGNHRKGITDERLIYAFNSVQAAVAVRPKIFILESVTGAYKKGDALLSEFTTRFHEAGYKVTYFLTDGSLHGLPQWRPRFHFIAHKVELPWSTRAIPRDAPVTTRDAIGDLEFIKSGEVEGHDIYEDKVMTTELCKLMEQGEDGYRLHRRVNWKGTKPSMLHKRPRYDTPSNTLVAVNLLVHPAQPRCFTVREAARLGGFPDWYTFRASGRRWPHDPAQIVTPVMGEMLASLASEAIKLDITADYDDETPGKVDEVIDYRDQGRRWHRETLKKWKEQRVASLT